MKPTSSLHGNKVLSSVTVGSQCFKLELVIQEFFFLVNRLSHTECINPNQMSSRGEKDMDLKDKHRTTCDRLTSESLLT